MLDKVASNSQLSYTELKAMNVKEFFTIVVNIKKNASNNTRPNGRHKSD